MMEDALTAVPPNAAQALEIYNEMKRCFPDADVPADLKRFSVAAAQAQVRPLANAGTTASVSATLRVYDDSKGVIASNDWDAMSLVAFARAMFHALRPDAETLAILDRLESIAPLGSAFRAEALGLRARIAASNGDYDKAKSYAQKIVDEFAANANPDVQLFVGTAQSYLGDKEAARTAYTAAKASASAYVQEEAELWLIEYDRTGPKAATAARQLEDFLNKYPDGVEFRSALTLYAALPEDVRQIKACATPVASVPCLCTLPLSRVLVQQGNWGCGIYTDKATCEKNPCGIRDMSKGVGTWDCAWSAQNKCEFVRLGIW
jgi:hypothetical protein